MLKAVIFDYDGVLIDSHGMINKLFTQVVNKELGLDLTEKDFARFPGLRFDKRVKIVAEEKKLDIPYENIHQAIEKGRLEYYTNTIEYIRLYDGAKRLLDELKEAGIKIGLGSNGSKRTIEKSLSILEIKDYFSSIVAFDDVLHPKPAPDMFLKNAENMYAEPQECIVIEDSAEGIEAAKIAGMTAVAVSTTEPEERLKEADLVVMTINDLIVEKLKKLVKDSP